MKQWILALTLLGLGGCGAETAGTAAVQAQAQQQAAQQAQELKQNVQNQLDAALLAEHQRLRALDPEKPPSQSPSQP